MRVLSLSDGARRLINEMKKLRLSLIFNEPAARARERAASADTMAVGGRGPSNAGGPRNITSSSLSRHLHAAGSRSGSRGIQSRGEEALDCA